MTVSVADLERRIADGGLVESREELGVLGWRVVHWVDEDLDAPVLLSSGRPPRVKVNYRVHRDLFGADVSAILEDVLFRRVSSWERTRLSRKDPLASDRPQVRVRGEAERTDAVAPATSTQGEVQAA